MLPFSIPEASRYTPRHSSDSATILQVEQDHENDGISVRSETSTVVNDNNALYISEQFSASYSETIAQVMTGVGVAMGFYLFGMLKALPKEKELSSVYLTLLAVLGLIEVGLYTTYKVLERYERATASERQGLPA